MAKAVGNSMFHAESSSSLNKCGVCIEWSVFSVAAVTSDGTLLVSLDSLQ